MAAAATRLVIIVEHLLPLARALASRDSAQAAELSAPSLSRFLARADAFRGEEGLADEVRCALFGVQGQPSPPVAALERAMLGGADAAGDACWIRLDPVILQADMARVFIMGSGFSGYTPAEQEAVLVDMQSVLAEEGLVSELADGHLLVKANDPPSFTFTPLETALGQDLGEALPSTPGARPWRRLVNELQVSLHHCEVNRRRREKGQSAVNGGWFWGAGVLPEVGTDDRFRQVFSQHEVSRGLAVLQGSNWHDVESFPAGLSAGENGKVLLDWTARLPDAAVELDRLEQLFRKLHRLVREDGCETELHAGEGRGWRLARRQYRRFWRRPKRLAEALGMEGP